MPNPKHGTLLDKPEQRKKELESGKITIRTEKKAPLLHVVIGNTQMETKQLLDNLQTLLDATANKLAKATLAATMSPGVKVKLEKQ
jgi:ribosomal protein L1